MYFLLLLCGGGGFFWGGGGDFSFLFLWVASVLFLHGYCYSVSFLQVLVFTRLLLLCFIFAGCFCIQFLQVTSTVSFYRLLLFVLF